MNVGEVTINSMWRLLFAAVGITTTCAAQNATPVPSFSVATIRLSQNAGPPILRPMLDGVRATNVTVLDLIRSAYELKTYQEVSGLPDWAQKDHYNVETRVDEDALDNMGKLDADQRVSELDLMLQQLVAERFHLALHKSTKLVDAYDLVVRTDTGGLKAALHPDPEFPNGTLRTEPGGVTAQAVPVSRLAQLLSVQLSAPVVDKTNLDGRYGFRLTWPPPDETATPSMVRDENDAAFLSAMQKQLGLAVRRSKAKVEVIVIEQITRPTIN